MSHPADERYLRERIATLGQRLYARGLSPGTSGNISVRLDDESWLCTPTNSCMGELAPDEISRLDWQGNLLGGKPPSKEYFFHLAYYANRPAAQAIVHLHSSYSSAVACLDDLDPQSALPPITPYFVMRVGNLPLLPYRRPGDERLGEDIAAYAPHHAAVLLANHGPVVTGKDLEATVSAAEELEETAKLYLLLRDKPYRELSHAQIAELKDVFGAVWES
ncbi:3-oxo-tetronate 4-phosphate decarboxylase [Salinicola halophilus]|uniref:3-oxo-tetronate 4-phosphate decarboxylase n=1 Tax=Salinicola halophilus TaxID=184065 RepID=UPI000DA15EFF|nr:3-oxo-tetronate 4-phosphate decarboxylase [Salinicola halophilus]